MGFSATGRTIEEALVHSEFPYAAAIADDNSDDNYVPACLYGWDIQVGTPLPFGEGLKAWLEHSPAFSVERIRTPLQFLVHSPSNTNLTVLWPWEMFSRLQYLGSPSNCMWHRISNTEAILTKILGSSWVYRQEPSIGGCFG